MIAGEQPDGVLLAGDIYDKSIPPAEAVQLFDLGIISHVSELKERIEHKIIVSKKRSSEGTGGSVRVVI